MPWVLSCASQEVEQPSPSRHQTLSSTLPTKSWQLEGKMLKLKLKHQYFGHLMWRVNSLEKTLMLGKIEDRGEADDRRWDGWVASLTQGTWVWANSGRQWRTGKPGMLQFMGLQRVGHDDWTTTTKLSPEWQNHPLNFLQFPLPTSQEEPLG